MPSAAIVLASCAAIQQSTGGWFGAAAPTPSPTPLAAAQAPRVYYAGVEGLEVHSESSSSSKVVGVLALHEKVTRSKLEHGYAYVESATSGLTGWVSNAQLIWRLPTAPTTSAPVEAQPAAPTEEEPPAPAAPQATATAMQPEPESTPVPAAKSQATPRGVGPSIFDAY